MRLLVLLTLSISIFNSCSTTKSSNGEGEGLIEPILTLHKGACFGTCPVYRVSIFSDGDFIYEAIRFHENHGIYSGQVSKANLDSLTEMAASMTWEKYPEYIESQIPDLPATTIRYDDNSVQFREAAPEALEQLSTIIERVVSSSDKRLKLESRNKEYLSKDALVVKFKDKSYPGLDFQTTWRPVIKSITPIVEDEGSYKMVINHEIISLGQAYYNLSRDPDILSVILK